MCIAGRGLIQGIFDIRTDGIGVLNAETTWALMAKGTQVDGLTELGESMIRHGRTTEVEVA